MDVKRLEMRRERVAIRAMRILAFIGSILMVSSTIPVFAQGIRKLEPLAAAISLTAPPT